MESLPLLLLCALTVVNSAGATTNWDDYIQPACASFHSSSQCVDPNFSCGCECDGDSQYSPEFESIDACGNACVADSTCAAFHWYGAACYHFSTFNGVVTNSYPIRYGVTETWCWVGSAPATVGTDSDGPYMTGGYAPYHTDARNGTNSVETIAAPDALTGIPYEDELIDKRGNPDSPYKDEFGNYTKDAADGGACNGKGFLCDFTQSSFGAQSEYTPQMVAWKIVDPQDVLYNPNRYSWQTLNCEVKIKTEDTNADQSNHWFYVPTGQENIQDRKGNYCDIEAVYREINDTALSMLDTITVRGESNRLNSTENAEQLIGEQFDLTCTCETKLETEAATTFEQADLALLTSMKGTAQERTMSVKLELYSDGGLTDQVAADATFPATEPSFFFLARHVYDNDWDVKLQLTTCIACPDSTGCSVLDGPGNSAVLFYETCAVKTGGPQLRGIDGDSWMQEGGFTNWSNADPTNSPYHVLGFQKFRLSTGNSMQVTCMVTGCEAGPNDCPPCGTRARTFFGTSRRLQSFGTSELAIGINFPSSGANQDETMAEDGTMAGQSSGSDSAAPVSFGLIAMAGAAAAACAYATRSFVKNRSAAAGRSVS